MSDFRGGTLLKNRVYVELDFQVWLWGWKRDVKFLTKQEGCAGCGLWGDVEILNFCKLVNKIYIIAVGLLDLYININLLGCGLAFI